MKALILTALLFTTTAHAETDYNVQWQYNFNRGIEQMRQERAMQNLQLQQQIHERSMQIDESIRRRNELDRINNRPIIIYRPPGYRR